MLFKYEVDRLRVQTSPVGTRKHYANKNIELQYQISNNVVCATIKASDQPTQTQVLSVPLLDAYFMSVKLLTKQHLEFLSQNSARLESTHVKI